MKLHNIVKAIIDIPENKLSSSDIIKTIELLTCDSVCNQQTLFKIGKHVKGLIDYEKQSYK